MYLAISSTNNVNKTPSTEPTYWWIAGKVYTGTDGIKVEGTVVKHDITRAANDTSTINVAAKNGQFTVKEETLDAWGHSLKTTTKTITLSQT